jgi:hypothetical protein
MPTAVRLTATYTVDQVENDIVVTATPKDSFCEEGNGSITLEVTGGTPDYIYAWTGPSELYCHYPRYFRIVIR